MWLTLLGSYIERRSTSCEITQAKDIFGRKIYLKEQETQGSTEEGPIIEDWSHSSRSKRYTHEADEPRWDRVKRVLATCLNRANEVRKEAYHIPRDPRNH